MSRKPSKQFVAALAQFAPMESRLAALADENRQYRYWYDDASESVAMVADHYGITIEAAACSLSALSPRVAVVRNVRLWRMLLNGEPQEGLGDMWSRAQDRLAGVGVAEMLANGQRLNLKSGWKTGCFAANLIGDVEPVTLDVWMQRAFRSDLMSSRPKYMAATEVVRRVARSLGWAPCEAQAAIWYGTAFAHGRKTMGDFNAIIRSEFEL